MTRSKIEAALSEATVRKRAIYKVTAIGSFVNLGLFVFKLLAGIFGRSSAMIADAFHSLSDFITDIIVVVFVRLSSKPADATHTYGHGKFETLATFFISLSMSLVGVGLLIHAIQDIVKSMRGTPLPEPEWIAFWAAMISIAAKEILYHYTIRRGRNLKSPAVIANAWHHRSDAMSSICTALGIGGAIALGGSWAILDPLAAAVVSVFIVKVGVGNMKPCLDELLERSLPAPVRRQIIAAIESVEEAGVPHHLQTRRIGTGYAIEFELRFDKDTTLEHACRVSQSVERVLKEKFGQNTHVGVHFGCLS